MFVFLACQGCCITVQFVYLGTLIYLLQTLKQPQAFSDLKYLTIPLGLFNNLGHIGNYLHCHMKGQSRILFPGS